MDIARKYDIAQTTVSRIRLGRSWKITSETREQVTLIREVSEMQPMDLFDQASAAPAAVGG